MYNSGPMDDPRVEENVKGEALARLPWLERTGGWIVLSFTIAFTAFLLLMKAAGQVPGQSFPLKSISDCLQFLGEGVGLVFALAVTIRLYRVSTRLNSEVRQVRTTEGQSNNDYVVARNEAQSVRRSYYAWLLLSIAIAVYACGQAAWTSYDVRMASSAVPYPGLYDIGFVSSYPFFIIGALLLGRQSTRRATIGRVRVLLDAFAVIGAALALSWFFILHPSIATLRQQPGFGAACLSIYFPGGDLLLVAIGAFLMFSQLSTREQQPVFLRLCLGLFFLAVTDSLLVWLSLSFAFNTGTVQDVLWPLSMQMVGLAAIAYPRSIAMEQERANVAGNTESFRLSTLSSLSLSLQTVAPFLLALGTCAILLTVVPTIDHTQLLLASLIALALFVLVAVRQALTLNENNRLRLQLAGELVVSRRELHVSRREADTASRDAQEKQRLEMGIAALQEVHSRIASGDFTVRASTDPGPLQTVAVSLNLVIERLKDLAQRANRYDQLAGDIRQLRDALEHLSRGLPPWSASSALNTRSELRSLFLSVERLQRLQLNQWKSFTAMLERIMLPLGRTRSTLSANLRQSAAVAGSSENTTVYSLTQVEQQLQRLIEQARSLVNQLEGSPSPQNSGNLPTIDPYQGTGGLEQPDTRSTRYPFPAQNPAPFEEQRTTPRPPARSAYRKTSLSSELNNDRFADPNL